MANQIKTSIIINATPQKVWNILMDFEKYSEWNSFILKISGKQKEGEYLNVQMEGMRFKPKVIKIICGKEFRWLGHLLFKGIFDGEHIFKITKNTNGSTLLEQKENFKGVLVTFLSKTLQKTALSFEAMNKELKARAERL